MSPAFNTAYTPPFPTIDLVVNAPEGAMALSVSALLDTGADITLVPMTLLEQAAARPFASGFLRSQWGERRGVDLYLLDISIGGLAFPGVEVAGDENSHELILGRNVLNKLSLFLDGPRRQSTVLDEAAVARLRTRYP